ncbi:MAG: hypothetical protein ACREOE_20480 [Gemmatimonadales bacterium]
MLAVEVVSPDDVAAVALPVEALPAPLDAVVPVAAVPVAVVPVAVVPVVVVEPAPVAALAAEPVVPAAGARAGAVLSPTSLRLMA